MSTRLSKLRERLEWVENARRGLLFCLGNDTLDPFVQAKTDADPLKAYVVFRLKRPLRKQSREPFRAYLREWAKIHDCEVPKISIGDRKVVATVFTKRRNWNRDEHGRFKPNRRSR